MISVDQALEHLFSLVHQTGVETVALTQADGRVLAQPLSARLTQPPFAASSMDGYAIRRADMGQSLNVIGEAAAGHGFDGTVQSGQAVRIFTGAPVPEGADFIVIQEDVTRDADIIHITGLVGDTTNIRPAGADFSKGEQISAARLIGPNDIALMAAMNIASVPVSRKPVVAIIATGDELVVPGEPVGPDQIVSSNTFGLHALLTRAGADCRLLPIARDNADSLRTCFGLCADADVILTAGGASVGDHDIVGAIAAEMGMERAFYKVAMRPGKPLMAGRMGRAVMLGLPGNPVSAMVCGHLFAVPLIRAMLGLPAKRRLEHNATLAAPLPANGPREHYMRAIVQGDRITALDRQDSALLSVLSDANSLLIRPPHDEALDFGAKVRYIPLSLT